ncbi:MAG: cbb3-type cytochrome c oxidase subunit 3 [Hyphomicrobium sp.]
MTVDHLDVVYVAKTYGLVFLVAFFVIATVYAYWPSNRQRFEEAAKSVIDDEDTPA